MKIDACKKCGEKVTECHCIEPGALHRRNPLDSAGRTIRHFQPEKCLRCKRVLGSDCTHNKEIFKHIKIPGDANPFFLDTDDNGEKEMVICDEVGGISVWGGENWKQQLPVRHNSHRKDI